MLGCDLNLATQENIGQILSKLNDTSFARSVRTCRRFRDVALKSDWRKGKLFCHTYFPIFVYFDEEEKKVLFDVPVRVKEEIDRWTQMSRADLQPAHSPLRMERGDLDASESGSDETDSEESQDTSNSMNSSSSVSDERSRSVSSDEEATEKHEPKNCLDIRICKRRECRETKEEQIFVSCETVEGLISHLCFALSRRKQAFYRKMTTEELAPILRIFRFKMISIDPYRNEDYSLSPKLALCADELLQIFPSLGCELFEIVGNNVPDHFNRIMSAATENLNFSRLYIHNNDRDGKIPQISEEYHRLEHLEAKIDKKDAREILVNFLQRWKDGETGLKELRLEIEEDPAFQGYLSPREIGFDQFIVAGQEERIFTAQSHHNPPRLALLDACPYYNYIKFMDVTDCEDCLCTTEFCTKKMLEFVTENLKSERGKSDVLDYGYIFDRWNGQRLQDLGDYLEGIFEGFLYHLASL